MIYIIVGIGGILGALARYYLGSGVDLFWHHPFPLATLIINLSGCFLLAWLMAYVAQLKILPPEMVTGIGTGFLGSFTTFSHFSVETVNLIEHSGWGGAFLYVACSMLGGLMMAAFGYLYGNRLVRKRLEQGGHSS